MSIKIILAVICKKEYLSQNYAKKFYKNLFNFALCNKKSFGVRALNIQIVLYNNNNTALFI